MAESLADCRAACRERRVAGRRAPGGGQAEGRRGRAAAQNSLAHFRQGELSSECACALQGGARRRLSASRRLAEDKQEDPETKQLREAAERRAGGSEPSMYMVVGFEARLPSSLRANSLTL